MRMTQGSRLIRAASLFSPGMQCYSFMELSSRNSLIYCGKICMIPYTTAITNVTIIAQKPNRSCTHAFGKSRVNRITMPIPNTISPYMRNSLSLVVLENNFAGGKSATLMCRSLRYIIPYHIPPSSKYTTRYIFSPIGNECGFIPPIAIAANTKVSLADIFLEKSFCRQCKFTKYQQLSKSLNDKTKIYENLDRILSGHRTTPTD